MLAEPSPSPRAAVRFSTVASAAAAPSSMEELDGDGRPVLRTFDSSETTSSVDEYAPGQDSSACSDDTDAAPAPHFAEDEVTPLTNFSSYGWSPSSANGHTHSGRSGTAMASPAPTPAYEALPPAATPTVNPTPSLPHRQSRPSNARQPSNAYAPARRPHQYSMSSVSSRPRNSSSHRHKRNPNAEYRAQEKAYVQMIRQDAPVDAPYEPPTPGFDYSSATESDETSPTGTSYADQDQAEVDTLLYYGNEDIEPSVEELKVPANRERLEWHAMLANVLTGDVFKQEKKRLIGGVFSPDDQALKSERWLGIRARVCGRTLAKQRHAVEEGRAEVAPLLEEICGFTLKSEAEVHKSALDQARDMISKMEKAESFYHSLEEMKAAQPRAASELYNDTVNSVISWYNTTNLINAKLTALQKLVGNPELDFTKPRERPEGEEHSHLFDDSSFIDRLFKEDGLNTLSKKDGLLDDLNKIILKAKGVSIEFGERIAARHLPPFIEELLTLINFPSRLIQEITRQRVAYAKKMKDPAFKSAAATAGAMTAEQMIKHFQTLLGVAVKVKNRYNVIAQPEPGWDMPPCIDENFDAVVLSALNYYFTLVEMKLSANKNTLNEAEILEQEWTFSHKLGRQIDGGDAVVAENFAILTHRSMARLATNFKEELQQPIDKRATTSEFSKRYKSILDSVRVRQRKIFRFGRTFSQRFENATEYMINIDTELFEDLLHALKMTGHIMVDTSSGAADSESEKDAAAKPAPKVYIIASPSLRDRSHDIQPLLSTCYRDETRPEDPTNPYLLIFNPEYALHWHGARMRTTFTPTAAEWLRKGSALGIRAGRMRLVVDGSHQSLENANLAFQAATPNVELKIRVRQRANFARVNREIDKIRETAHRLSNTIMDSVAIVRAQTAAAGRKAVSQELIQYCYAFATEFGQRSAIHMDAQMRDLNQHNLTKLALDWVSFICDDCVPSDRKTFRWAVVALEFAMIMTRGQNILSISEEEYTRLRHKVAGCMSLLISHFDIMGARSNAAAQAERQRIDATDQLRSDEESAAIVRQHWLELLGKIEEDRQEKETEAQIFGRVLEDSNEADRALTYLSADAGNVHLRWEQGQFVGAGTFGSVYCAVNLDSNHLMAVKEIRLQDPKMIPAIIAQIRDEIGVLQGLDHPNIVQYYGIEPHRDKVYIFMEFCSRGSLAANLEYGRIEDEMVVQVYALQLLEGLGYLHEKGIVHRDIKPENILLDHMGVIKFVDFGAAKVIAKQGKTVVADRTGRAEQAGMAGTPMYMAPEAIAPNDFPHTRLGSVDIWSLGCVVSEMATALRPWSNLDNEFAIMYTIAHGPGTPSLPTKDQLSALGIDFLKKCFDRDPARRASAAELLQHEWIQNIKVQQGLEPGTPATPASDFGGGFPGSAVLTPTSSANGS